MKNNAFIVAQKVTGQERKAIAAVISEATGKEVKYLGPPTFSYEIGGWTIEKTGNIRSPETEPAELESIKPVLAALKDAGLKAEDDLSVILSATGHTGVTLRNLINLVSSKDNLLRKALNRQSETIPGVLVEALNAVPIETAEDFMRVYNSGLEAGKYTSANDIWLGDLPDNLWFSFYNATLDFDEVSSYIILSRKLNEQAKVQKHASNKQKEAENEKYALRCFLLRLGFIGDEYKSERKVLLSRLEGNGSWKRTVTVA